MFTILNAATGFTVINFMSPMGGFYAECTAIKARNVAKIPPAWSTRDAGVLAIDGVIAL